MDKVFVIQGLANKLWATENSMDAAMADAARLMSGLVEGREEIGCSPLVIDGSMTKVAEAISKMAEARHALVEAHAQMTEAKLRLGVRTKLIGGAPKVDEAEPHVAQLDRRAS